MVKPDEPGTLMIRARDPEHLRRLQHRHGVVGDLAEQPGSDYRWRIFVTQAQWVEIMAAEARAIDYDNFKDACGESDDGRYVQALHVVWAALAGIQRNVERGQRGHSGTLDEARSRFDPEGGKR